jgi:hypothetical protein
MDAAAAGQGELRTYADVEEFFNNMSSEGPSAQDRIDYIVPYIISLLPPPFVPAPDAASDSDSEDEHFSLTSSSDDEGDAAVSTEKVTTKYIDDKRTQVYGNSVFYCSLY